MRIFLFCLTLLMAPLITHAAPNFEIPTIKPAMNAHYQFHQQDLNFEDKAYRLFIAEPKKPAHATLYLLDGNAQFPLAVNAVDPNLPLPLIIGVSYVSDKAYAIEQRTRDYTFPATGEAFKQGGQAVDFLRFFANQVKPYVVEHYGKTTPEYFFGHSFGGLFGLYVLFHQPTLFDYYSIASPSLWWGHGEFLKREKPWVSLPPKSVWVSLGEFEKFPERDPEMTPAQLEKIQQRQKMAWMNAEQLATELQQQGVPTTFQLITGKNHGAVIPEAIAATMQQIQR